MDISHRCGAQAGLLAADADSVRGGPRPTGTVTGHRTKCAPPGPSDQCWQEVLVILYISFVSSDRHQFVRLADLPPALLLALCSGGVVGIRDRARAAAAFVGLRIKNLR